LIVDEHDNVICDKHGRPKPFRLAIVAPGGGMSGVVSAGMFEVLQEEGYNDDPVGLLAVSAGVPNALAFGCKKSHEVIPFYENLIQQRFIRFFTRGDPRMRLYDDVIVPMIRMLDHEALRSYKPKIYTVVTEWESGKGRIVRLRVEENPSEWGMVAQAAMTIPGFSPEVELTGIIPGEPHRKVKCADGASSLPLPLGEAMRIIRPSHILILAPRPTIFDLPAWESRRYRWTDWWESWIALLFMLDVPAATRRGTFSMDDQVSKSLKRMHEIHPRIECTALFPKASSAVSVLESDPGRVHKAGERGKELMRECLLHAHMAVKRHQGDAKLEPAS